MENALWNGKLYLASEIAEDYALEKEIRKASGRKELCCPDSDCDNPILRYCHGEIKDAFFAHLNNEHCDYANFDKETTQIMRTIRRCIFEHFKNKGYNVRLEVKLIPHHYTHLYFEMQNGEKVAVEIGSQHLSANRIDYLAEQYHQEGISVKWIVLGNTDIPVRENQTFFLKRYLLNESNNRDLIVINWDATEVAQFKVDPNKYEYNGQTVHSNNYPEVYCEFATLDNLTFENSELSFQGFQDRYSIWLHKKKAAFEKKLKQINDKVTLYQEQQLKLKLLQEQQTTVTIPSNNYSAPKQSVILKKHNHIEESSKSYDERRQEIIPLISQQKKQVRDSLGKRWVKCEICGAIETDDKFSSYGGIDHVNLGQCYNCSRKK